jgi:14-3-3 protein epsilon
MLNDFYLDEEERNLFMKAAKAKFNFYRNAWKVLLDYEQQEEEELSQIPLPMIKSQMENYEKLISNFCMTMDYYVSKLLDKLDREDINAIIFYKKLRADYLRYYSEVAGEEIFTSTVEKCEEIYKEAYNMCNELEPHNVLTLSVALNYSIFVYFIIDDTHKAYDIADKAYKNAMVKLNTEQRNMDVDNVIKNLEENLTIWKIELFDVS